MMLKCLSFQMLKYDVACYNKENIHLSSNKSEIIIMLSHKHENRKHKTLRYTLKKRKYASLVGNRIHVSQQIIKIKFGNHKFMCIEET